MNTLVQQKQKIDELEVECNMLRNMIINLSKDSHSAASNHRMPTNSLQADPKEEDTVHQMLKDMGNENQNSLSTNHGKEEANSSHAFR